MIFCEHKKYHHSRYFSGYISDCKKKAKFKRRELDLGPFPVVSYQYFCEDHKEDDSVYKCEPLTGKEKIWL